MRIAALVLVSMSLAACATARPDENARLCAILDAMNSQQEATASLTSDQSRRLRAIVLSNLTSDVACGATTYRHSAPRGVSYVSAGIDPSGRYAAVQTHTQDGQYFVAGSVCLLQRRGQTWQKLGCDLRYIS